MSNPKLYRVRVVTWDVFDIWLSDNREQFHHRYGELDCVEAEEVER